MEGKFYFCNYQFLYSCLIILYIIFEEYICMSHRYQKGIKLKYPDNQ